MFLQFLLYCLPLPDDLSQFYFRCETCGGKCDVFKNCENYDCHVRFIQCEKCVARYKGCCCAACEKMYTEQCEEKENIALQEAYRRQAKLARDRQMQPLPRRGSLTDNGLTKKQMVDIKKSIDEPNCQIIEIPPEEDLAWKQKIMKEQEDESSEVALRRVDNQSNGIGTGGGAGWDNKVESPAHQVHISEESALSDSSFDEYLIALGRYAERMSSQESTELASIRVETKTLFGAAARMLSGPLQGQVLSSALLIKSMSLLILPSKLIFSFLLIPSLL